jgi:hypothetical protein
MRLSFVLKDTKRCVEGDKILFLILVSTYCRYCSYTVGGQFSILLAKTPLTGAAICLSDPSKTTVTLQYVPHREHKVLPLERPTGCFSRKNHNEHINTNTDNVKPALHDMQLWSMDGEQKECHCNDWYKIYCT